MGETRVWQIACGERRREYSWLFQRHDVMFLGPGDPGRYSADKYATVRKRGLIAKFAEHVRPNDMVLLRLGDRAINIGVVPDERYEWHEWLDDVYGWDLQHCRRVIWQEHLAAELLQIQSRAPLFANKRGRMFARVHSQAALKRVSHLFTQCRSRKLRALPTYASQELSLEDFGQLLFSKGLPNSAVDRAIQSIRHARRMLSWYAQHGKASGRPDEHEVIAHLVLPLLVALGWSEQLLAVEWNKVDLAAFRDSPTTAATCVLACEAKRMGLGLLEEVVQQARGYVRRLQLHQCRQILITDGPRFHLYRRTDGKWDDAPSGYINLLKLRSSHLAPENTNAVDTLMALTPAGVERA